MAAPLRLGMVGFGSFGRFMAGYLKDHFEVVVTDCRPLEAKAAEIGVGWGNLEQVARSRVVVLAVPTSALEGVVVELRQWLAAGTLVADVCSVKQRPVQLLERLLPREVEVLGTHPMFGPQSGRDGIAGLKVVVCPVRTTRLDSVRRLLEQDLGLQVLEMSPERHDREMAYIQGLTHWMAKALREITLPDTELSTPAYRHLLQIEEILREDSDELFLTIQRDNAFVQEARSELTDRLTQIERWIEEHGLSGAGEDP